MCHSGTMSGVPTRLGEPRNALPSKLQIPEASVSHLADLQAELLDRLANEKPKDPLDLRNRLDSQGKRYGKVIEFR